LQESPYTAGWVYLHPAATTAVGVDGMP